MSEATTRVVSALAERTVTDSLGRVLIVKDLDPVEQLDLFEACGSNSTNPPWVGTALLVCTVRTIDGLPVPFPTKAAQVRATLRKLGAEGMDALRAERQEVGGEIDDVDPAVAKN